MTFIACICFVSLQAATISLSPGTDVLKKAISTASAGDVFVLSNGMYEETSSLKPTCALTIKADDGTMPVINMKGRFEVKNDFNITGIIFIDNGAGEAVRMVPGTAAYNVNVETCEFDKFTSRVLRVYNSDQTAPYVNKLTVNNCLFCSPGARCIEASATDRQIADVTITNSTFDGGKDGTSARFIYFLKADKEDAVKCTINHCTFWNCSDTRGVYLGDIYGVDVRNCIYANPQVYTDSKSYCLYGETSSISNCISYNCDTYLHDAKQKNIGASNPFFVDPENGNFQLYRNSPAVGAADNFTNLGDPRWGVSTKNKDLSDLPYTPYKEPYTMCPTTNSIKVLWQMAEETQATEGMVCYGTAPDALNDTVYTDNGWMVQSEGFVHIVTLSNLKPFTRYYYKVGDRTRVFDKVCSTKTAPEAGTAFRIFTISDIHGNSCNNWSNMQDFICNLNPDISVMSGDFVSDNGADRNWNSYFFTPGAQFLSQVPIMSAIGNHETGVPQTYRWSCFYDYFHQFSHGAETDSIKDPRGEAYFIFHYGNADIICFDDNQEPSSPSCSKGSVLYNWLDETIGKSTAKWIITFSHVGIHTSGYHGQWEDGQTALGEIFEKYAAQGKHIISCTGDDHSFEHLYKDGVHYLRPGCGRNSNYAQQTQLKDAEYSMFYRKISCYSTLDMSADASQIHLTARDSAGNVFYEYTFKHEGEVVQPKLTFQTPLTEVATADSVLINWFSFDPGKNSTIALYYTQNPDATNGTLIADGLSALPGAQKKLYWQTRNVFPKGKYYIYGTITNPDNTSTTIAPGAVILQNDTTPPSAPYSFRGDLRDGKFFLGWFNPVHPTPLTTTLADFSSGMDNFVNENEEGQATATLAREDGALKVDYNIITEWSTAAANYVFAEPVNIKNTPTLSFRLKGNGTSTDLRLVCKNMTSGHEDWWYTEAFSLNKKTWQTCTIDLRQLSAFEWYENSDPKNLVDGVVCISFSISTGTPSQGTFYLDDVCLKGFIAPDEDFQETAIIRNDNAFPTSITDGTEIYRGSGESCYDETADTGKTYYYGAFAIDDRGNVSAPEVGAQWLSTNLDPKAGLNNTLTENNNVTKRIENNQIIIVRNTEKYTLLGTQINQ